jgi:hypothetical protein
MAVRAIPASTRRRLPNRIQSVFRRAATFIQLLAWVDIKMHKAVEAWKQKKVHINNMYIQGADNKLGQFLSQDI